MKALLSAFPLALFSIPALAIDDVAARSGGGALPVLLFLAGLVVAVIVFVTYMARSGRKKDTKKQ